MTSDELKRLRGLTPYSQSGFAKQMGVPLRTYEDLEAGRSTVRPVHLNAATWAVVKAAAEVPIFTNPGLSDEIRSTISRALEQSS